jgi:hypothetical protein
MDGCGASGDEFHGEFVGTICVSTHFKDPLTADADLCAVPPIYRYCNKFRDGIHPDSGRGPVILLSPYRPIVEQLFDGSDYRTDWGRWYVRSYDDYIFYFDENMPEFPEDMTLAEKNAACTAWFNENLPMTVNLGKLYLTLYSYERLSDRTELNISMTW